MLEITSMQNGSGGGGAVTEIKHEKEKGNVARAIKGLSYLCKPQQKHGRDSFSLMNALTSNS